MHLIFINRTIFLLTISIMALNVLIYGLFLIYYYGKDKKTSYNYEVNPEVTILIPTHNEEKIIHKRISNIYELDYPKEKINVIFIDDSTDSTPEIIDEYVKQNENFKLIKFNQRMGYSPSIMAGVKEAETDIIILNEAGSLPSPDSITNLVRHFQDDEIGCVSGRSVILNIDEKIGNMETLYLKILNFFRKAESNLDSTFSIQGEAMAVKRNLVLNAESREGTGSVDTSMAFEVRLRDKKSIYDPEVVFHEYSPNDNTGWIKQKTIRAANWMRILIIYRKMFLNPRYGKFGILVMPFYALVLFAYPFLAPIATLNILIGIFIDPLFINIGLTIGLLLVIGIIFFRKLITLLIHIEISLLNATYQIYISRRSHDKIERVESTRRV
jgi:cellulose synthase/poly-beta-1,6-N-acetylglucosamine synthase-like glycosyltransferase